jgi:predicted ArsR family transcriptional regulator
MGKSSSELIIHFLSNNKPSTVLNLSKNLNLTKADIRYHLKTLINLGVVRKIESNGTTAPRGRPAARFTISSTALPNNFSELLEILLLNNLENKEIFAIIAQIMLSNMKLSNHSSIIELLNDLIKELNLRNYDSRWETHNAGPIIFISNCPYRSLLKRFRAFCNMDKIIISQYIGKSIDHKSSFIESTKCSFQIRIFERVNEKLI